jgi:YfiH family protein
VKYDWIQPDWPAPRNIRALSTTRSGGVSLGPWSSLNLGNHCGDDLSLVEQNRARLNELLPAPARWLRQVHGSVVVHHSGQATNEIEGDAQVSFEPGMVCSVLTADCLPVFFCNRSGDRVGVAHAGWRGLASGVLEATTRALREAPAELMAWMGPAIGPEVYQVGSEVAAAFPQEFSTAFTRKGTGFLLDIYTLAKLKLAAVGVHAVSGGTYCTLSDPDRFFSYRRDGVTGRMASLVWLDGIKGKGGHPT